MFKRPCCLLAAGILFIQLILVGWFQISRDLKPSYLEQNYLENENVIIEGKVYDVDKRTSYSVYYLKDIQVYQKSTWVKIKRERVLVNVKDSDSIMVGNIIQASGKIYFFQENRNPGNFNQKFYYQKQHIHAQIWSTQIQINNQKTDLLKENLFEIRESIKNMLLHSLGKDAGNSMAAILLGDKKDLDQTIKQLYQKGGIGHILAISGLHMSFIGIGIYQVLRRLGLGFSASGIIGILFLLLYTMMIGIGVSSLRAIIMYIIRMGAEVLGRDYDLLTSLSIAVVVIVLWQPLYLFDAGFLFSFGAVLAMILINPLFEQTSCIPKIFCPGIAIQVMLLPMTMYFYFEISTWSVLTNIIVIPCMSILIGIGIVGILLSFIFHPIGNLILQLCKAILWGYEKLCMVMIDVPFGRIVTGKPSKWIMIAYYGALLISYFMWKYWDIHAEKQKYKSKSRKDLIETEKKESQRICLKSRYFAIRSVVCTIALFGIVCLSYHQKGDLEITMLDVGQGDGIFIRTPNGTNCLIDGGSTDVSQVGLYRLIPFLESKGVGCLDYIFISHGDEDHMNGVKEMLESQKLNIKIKALVLPVKEVWDDKLKDLSKTAEENHTKVIIMSAGQQFAEYKEDISFTLTCIGPVKNYSGENGNAASMVLDLKFDEFDMLFTGDLEGEGETQLIESGSLRKYDILKVAHHGSKNSTPEKFLEITSPSVVLISAGVKNRYGHPHQETLERLNKENRIIYNTQNQGAIDIKTNGKDLRINVLQKVSISDII